MGISNTLLDLFESFSWKKIQKAVLNSQTSEQLPIKTGVPQGSTFGPLLFLTYINDLSLDIISTVKLFANNTSLFSIIHDFKIAV